MMTIKNFTFSLAKNRGTIALLACLSLSSCYNSTSSKATSSKSSKDSAKNALIAYDSFKISTITITVPESNDDSAGALPVTIQFNLATSSESMLNSCTKETGAMPCLCKFSWNEINSSTNPATSIPRLVYTNITSVQRSVVGCTTPDVYNTEIPGGTKLNITIVPAAGNPNQFNVSTYAYVKGEDPGTGNFKDNQGRSFVNVLRYACYDQRQRGMSIKNRTRRIQMDSVGEFPYPIANRFCVRKFDGSSRVNDGCEDLDPVDFTAQSYYYNLYIRDSESGDINPGNAVFVCPTVKEALNTDGNAGTEGKYWPMDTSFALALGKTADFSVGVVANSKTSNVNDPTAQNTSCEGSATSASAPNSLVSSCLGFAAKPATDGTCPAFKKSDGTNLQTYRLRRYIAVYPPTYDTDGTPLNEAQPVDTIYVLDRPVKNGTEEFTMLGPKPCPFAYFDHKGETNAGGTPRYMATGNSAWNGLNVDGIKLPNKDSLNSCAAMLPLVNKSMNKITLATVFNGKNDGTGKNPDPRLQKVYVRPGSAWSPHYEEDTGFTACAPLADPLRDPPLHFAKTATGNVAWCAEAYPSQNDNIARIEPSLAGNVKPFTSHTIKGTTAGGSCTATQKTAVTNYPAGGAANHIGADANTCDRTVVNPVAGVTWSKFPLLAPAADVEAALQNDPSYSCLVTYDKNGSKSGVSSPTEGCCGSTTRVWTGAAAAPNNATSAHLPPVPITSSGTPSCATPNY